jgi:hypothetical protein
MSLQPMTTFGGDGKAVYRPKLPTQPMNDEGHPETVEEYREMYGECKTEGCPNGTPSISAGKCGNCPENPFEGQPEPTSRKLQRSFELRTPKGSTDEEVREAIEEVED